MEAKSIMLIEDDEDVREVITEILADEGYVVAAFANGADALDELRQGRATHGNSALPKVILLDLMMPVMDGWRFLEERGKDPALDEIPVVVMSATAQNLSGLPGAEEFLKKPVDLNKLLATVAQYA